MTITASGAISFNSIRTEFGGTNNISLAGYKIGAGNVANHENNATIPTTNSNISLNKYYGCDIDMEGTGYGTASWTTSTAYPTFSGGSYLRTQTGWGADPNSLYSQAIGKGNHPFGSIGTIDLVGKGKSNLTQVQIYSIYNASDQGVGGLQLSAGIYFLGGTNTGSWWSSIKIGSSTVNRSSADVVNGTSSGGYSYWTWSGPSYQFDFGPYASYNGTFNITVTL